MALLFALHLCSGRDVHFVPEVHQSILLIRAELAKIDQHNILVLLLARLIASPLLSQAEVPAPVEAVVERGQLTFGIATRGDAHGSRIAVNVVHVRDDVDQHAATDVNVVDVLVLLADAGVQNEAVAERQAEQQDANECALANGPFQNQLLEDVHLENLILNGKTSQFIVQARTVHFDIDRA